MRDEAHGLSFCPDQGTKGELASNDDQIPPESDEYVPSEIANGIPEMPDDEYQRLKEDIRLHGQTEPIRVRGHDIIDGRSRYRACKELNLPVKTVQVEGADEELHLLSLSLNFHRRHLTKGQKAALIVKMTPDCPRGRPKKSAAAAGLSSRKNLAKKHQVGPRLMEKAVQVRRGDPEIFEKVVAGDLPMEQAVKEIQAKQVAQNDDDIPDANGEPPDSPDGPVDAVEVKGANEKLQKAKEGLRKAFQAVIRHLPEEDNVTFIELATKVCDFLDINLNRNAVIN